MIGFGIRNLKVFFKDKSAVFFSLLSVFILIGLYALFLGDMLAEMLNGAPGAKFLMDSWMMAGLLSVTSVTATMGAFGVMVEDKAKKINKDFIASPIKNTSIVGGYIGGAIVVGIFMCIIAAVLIELYVVLSGGALMSAFTMLKLLGLIVLTTLANSSIVLFMVSFFSSSNAFAAASTVLGTMLGFLTGIYMPIGSLPEAVQWVLKCFPPSHGAALLRQVMMEAPMAATFADAPAGAMADFKLMMGVEYSFNGMLATPLTSILILITTTVAFYALSVWNLSRKKK